MMSTAPESPPFPSPRLPCFLPPLAGLPLVEPRPLDRRFRLLTRTAAATATTNVPGALLLPVEPFPLSVSLCLRAVHATAAVMIRRIRKIYFISTAPSASVLHTDGMASTGETVFQ